MRALIPLVLALFFLLPACTAESTSADPGTSGTSSADGTSVPGSSDVAPGDDVAAGDDVALGDDATDDTGDSDAGPAPADTGAGDTGTDPGDAGPAPQDPGPDPADPGGVDAGCGPPPPGTFCCCDMDAVTDIVCEQAQWTCPGGFQWFSGDDCTAMCGPCSLPCEDQDAGPAPHDDLTASYSKSGGFAGWTTTVDLTDAGVLAAEQLGGPGSGSCAAPLDATTLDALQAAAAAVDWAAVQGTYVDPDNPFCCCDQFVYGLHGALGATAFDTKWCDASLADGNVPQYLADFAAALETAGKHLIEACPE